jgi:hypothetical protein
MDVDFPDARVDPLTIKEQFTELPGRLAYWNARLADAHERLLEASAVVKLVTAAAQLTVRAQLAGRGEKVTESIVDAHVACDAACVQALLVEIDAEVEKQHVRGRVDALHAKRDMLMSLGAMLREEMKGDPMIREMVGR